MNSHIFKNRIPLLFTILLFLFLSSCLKKKEQHQESQQTILLAAPQGKEAVLSMKTDDKQHPWRPYHRIFANKKIVVPQGNFLISNECSHYAFSVSPQEHKTIYLNHLKLILKSRNTQKNWPRNMIPSKCEDVLTHRKKNYTNHTSYDFLPGENQLKVAGRAVRINFPNLPDQSTSHEIYLSALNLRSIFPNSKESFYVYAIENFDTHIISVPVNTMIWLYPGRYLVEINGTQRNITLNENQILDMDLGNIHVSSPDHFPFSERLQKGGLPTNFYLHPKILLPVDYDHLVFPGHYELSINESEVKKEINVVENERTLVKTYGFQVNAPDCATEKECSMTSLLNIHNEQMPFILMSEKIGLPFMTFQGEYSYTLAGLKGIYKKMRGLENRLQSENLGAVELTWEPHYTSSNMETKFVRVESQSSDIHGKSVDLSRSKPKLLYLPEGYYTISYNLGDLTGPNKNRRILPLHVSKSNFKKVKIPYYIKVSAQKLRQEMELRKTQERSHILRPIKQ